MGLIKGDTRSLDYSSYEGLRFCVLYGTFLKLGVPVWGVPVIRIVVNWGPRFLENYQMS